MKFLIVAFLCVTTCVSLSYDHNKFEAALKKLRSGDGPEVYGEINDINFVFECMKEDWPSVKARLPKMTLTQQDAILAIAMKKMNDVEYLNFTIDIIDGIVDGDLTEEIVCHSILMPNETKGFFPAINYKDPRLVNSLTKLEAKLKDQNKSDLAECVNMILDGDAYAIAQDYFKMARMTIAPSVEQLRKVGKNNRWDWTAADAVAINRVEKSYGNGPESWKLQGTSQWLIVVVGLVILGGLGFFVHCKFGNVKKNLKIL